MRGYLFEAVVLRLIEANGFMLVPIIPGRTRQSREAFLEVKGRGTWHQIDCPCDYTRIIPFMYPIRMLGEVKFFTKPISKDYVREFIGAIKDIQENYFVDDENLTIPDRVSEVGVFFSASGFEPEAEKLAFVHNIRTVSYANNPLIDRVKKIVSITEEDYLDTQICLRGDGTVARFLRSFTQVLSGEPQSLERFVRDFRPRYGFREQVDRLLRSFMSIEASFVGTTSGGALLHFVGSEPFPEEVFQDTDEQMSRVYYEGHDNHRFFYMMLNQDARGRRFYFTPPIALAEAAFRSQREAAIQKMQLLRTVHIPMRVNDINRHLVIRLDTDWLEPMVGYRI
ncbi:MAG: hypothetical protein ACM3WU_05460 [Bacillota bacterium]